MCVYARRGATPGGTQEEKKKGWYEQEKRQELATPRVWSITHYIKDGKGN